MYLWALFNERNTNYDLCNSFCELTLPRPRADYLKRSLLVTSVPFVELVP